MVSRTLACIALLLAFTSISATPVLAQAKDSVVETATPDTAAQTTTRATPIATIYPAEAAGDGAVTAGYAIARWAENWTRYRDPALRDDPLDRLKFIPIGGRDDVYLTLSGEIRGRVDSVTNPGARDAARIRQRELRLFAGGDLHLGTHVRLYGELAHGGLAGDRARQAGGDMRNTLIVQQAFAEVSTALDAGDVGVRYGRQIFADGPGLLVSQGDAGNIQVVLNGVRGWAHLRPIRADIFDLRFTRYGTGGTGDDRIDHAQRFSGVTTGIVLPPTLFGGSKLYLEPFAWRLRRDAVTFGGDTAREARHFYGLRLWGDAGRVTLDWTANRQTGRFGARAIDAWQVFAAQTIRLGEAGTSPRIGLHLDYGSGGGAYGRGSLRNAAAPALDGGYFSYQNAFSPTNFIAVAPNFTLSPIARVRLTVEAQRVWRARTDDAVYAASGRAYAGTQSVRGTHVADVARAQLVWSVAPRVSITGRYEHLIARSVLSRSGFANSDCLSGWISLKL